MKKGVSIILSLIMCSALLVGCGQGTKKDSDGNTYNTKFKEKSMSTVAGTKVKLSDDEKITLCKTSGFAFVKPKTWSDVTNQDCLDGYGVDPEGYYMMYMPEEQVKLVKSIDKDTMSKEKISKIKETAYNSEYYLFVIYRVNEDDETTIADAEEFKADFKNNEKIGTVGKDTFYFAYNNEMPKNGLSSDDVKNLEKMIDNLEEVKKNIIIFPPTDPMDDFKASMSQFSTTDLNGEKVTQDIFKDYDVTMVNVWATWCKYCVSEMPEIQSLYEELPDKTNIITICTDGDTQKDTAKELLNKTGAKFTTILSCDEIEKNVLEYVTGYPTTFFVDKNGKVVGKLQIGTPSDDGKNKEAYLELLKNAVDSVK